MMTEQVAEERFDNPRDPKYLPAILHDLHDTLSPLSFGPSIEEPFEDMIEHYERALPGLDEVLRKADERERRHLEAMQSVQDEYRRRCRRMDYLWAGLILAHLALMTAAAHLVWTRPMYTVVETTRQLARKGD